MSSRAYCSSQKNESMNRVILRYAPKDRTYIAYCQSMSLTSRICLAVGIDSVGHEEDYERLFEKRKLRFPNSTRNMLLSMKKKRDDDRKYQALPKRKRKRSQLKFANMKDGMNKQMADKAMGLVYETGMNMAQRNFSTQRNRTQTMKTAFPSPIDLHPKTLRNQSEMPLHQSKQKCQS